MTPALSGEQGSVDVEPATRFNAESFAFEKKAAKSKAKKAASKAKRGKAGKIKATGSHQNCDFGKRITDDDEFTAEMARYLREDPNLSWSGVLKLMRQDGIGGGTRRAERLLPAAKKLAKEPNDKIVTGKRGAKRRASSGPGARRLAWHSSFARRGQAM